MENLVIKQKQLLRELETSFRRDLVDDISWSEKMIGIKGARGVGKTTLILQYIHENETKLDSFLYISMDNIDIPYSSIYEMADEFYKRGGKILFIDEIHKYQGWALELKNIYDTHRNLKVVFTGSSVLHIADGKADLSRRAVMYHLHGLSFREFLEIETGKKFAKYTLKELLKNHEEIAGEILAHVKPLEFFSGYLKYGYYPFYLQSKATYHIKLSQVIQLVLESDLPYLCNIDLKYIGKLKKLLQLLGVMSPFQPNITVLANTIEMSRQTLLQYLHHFREAELLHELFKEGKSYSLLSKPEKIYLFHPNHFYLFGKENLNKGALRESFFLNQVSVHHDVAWSELGDFSVDDNYIFEVGGKAKNWKQIKNIRNSFIASDNIEMGTGNKIPLWLFGFLY